MIVRAGKEGIILKTSHEFRDHLPVWFWTFCCVLLTGFPKHRIWGLSPSGRQLLELCDGNTWIKLLFLSLASHLHWSEQIIPAVSPLAFSQVDVTNSLFKMTVPGFLSICCGALAS